MSESVDASELETPDPATLPPAPPPETPAAEPEPETPPPQENPLAEQIKGMSAALTRLQQTVATLGRQKANQGGELTEEQEHKRQQAVAESQRLTRELAKYASEANPDGEELGQKLAKKLAENEERLNRLEAENTQLKKAVVQNQPSDEDRWKKLEAEHGKQVRTIWKKSIDEVLAGSTVVKKKKALLDAGQITQAEFDETVTDVATDKFYAKLAAAKLPTASPPPPPPPPGVRTVPMRGGQNPAPPSDADPMTELIMRELGH